MVNFEELRKKHQELNKEKAQSSFEGAEKFILLPEGKTTIRILPWKDDSKQFYTESHIHRYTDSEGNTKSYYCRALSGEDCPLCNFRNDLWKMHRELVGKDSKSKSKYGDLASAIRANPRYMMNVVDRGLQAKDKESMEPQNWVKIFSTGQTVFKKILDTLMSPDYMDEDNPEETSILSIKKGNDFVIEKIQKGDWPNYDGSIFRVKKTPIASDRDTSVILESLHDIHALVKASSYEDGKSVVSYLKSTLDTVRGPSKSKSETDGEGEFNEAIKV